MCKVRNKFHANTRSRPIPVLFFNLLLHSLLEKVLFYYLLLSLKSFKKKRTPPEGHFVFAFWVLLCVVGCFLCFVLKVKGLGLGLGHSVDRTKLLGPS